MTSSTEVFVGLDVGTTTSKALVRTADHRHIVVVEAPTPWRTDAAGTDAKPEALLSLVVQLIRQAVHTTESTIGAVHVAGIAVAGMAECGVLLDRRGRPAAPVLAWFDRRGQEQVDRVARWHPGFADAFESKTGLQWSCQASIAKLMWLRDNGILIQPGARWLSVPEWIVSRLGGEQVREPSLASRTGLIDQNNGDLWPEALTVAGLPAGLLPAELPAGQCAGRLRSDAAPACTIGAALTVAGHDHAVAALGVNAVGPDEVFNSSGTADVVARSVAGAISDGQRHAIVRAGWSAGRHVVPHLTLLLAGVRGGLLLRRVLSALGADSPADRAALDRASLAVTTLPPGLDVTGAGRTGNDVVIHLQDDVSPAALWAAATRYTAAQTSASLANIERLVGPHRHAVASGGWTRMASVRAAKAAAIARLTFSPVTQPGLTGAALLASYVAAHRSLPIVDFIAELPDAADPIAVPTGDPVAVAS